LTSDLRAAEAEREQEHAETPEDAIGGMGQGPADRITAGPDGTGWAVRPDRPGTADASGTAEALASDAVYRFEVRPHHCFVCGELNTHGLRLPIHVSHDRAWADLRLGEDHTGWEGVAHGGILAALLDEVMGWALFTKDAWGVTAQLTTRYRHPVRVGVPIHVEGWIAEERGRIKRTAGRILGADCQELVTAEGTYLEARAEQKEELKRKYGFRLVRVPKTVA
jgi:acyl-coenzyme A thioesterase PaaI-like protein